MNEELLKKLEDIYIFFGNGYEEQSAYIKSLVEADLSIKNTQIYLACANGLPKTYVKKLEKEKRLSQKILKKILTAENNSL